MSFMLITLAWMHKKAAGYPVGGSLEFARSIERRYLALGGDMNYKTKVSTILTENDSAVGIRLEDGTEHHFDYIVSAADGYTTIFKVLEGNYVDDTIRGYYEKLIPFPPLVHVALGVNRRFDDVPSSARGTTIVLQEPVILGGRSTTGPFPEILPRSAFLKIPVTTGGCRMWRGR